ncbi:phosphatidylserine decarboxylase [bacterium]|nr:phosphatidylserine decarboxylase [bacterium]
MPLASPGIHLDRYTRGRQTEPVAADALIRLLYENGAAGRGAARLFACASVSRLLAYWTFGAPWARGRVAEFARENAIDLTGVLGDPASFASRTDLFLRRLDYENARPMPAENVVVSPADSKVIGGDLDRGVKAKGVFFTAAGLLGARTRPAASESARRVADWAARFEGGTFFVFRLAPPDYHWFHAPVAGRVAAAYGVAGRYHSVNPRAVRARPGLLAENARHVTLIDTDAGGGTGVGLVAVVPVAALVIGKIVMRYSPRGYDEAQSVAEGLFIERGKPMGYFAPGSSTVVALFERGRVTACPDIVDLQYRDAGAAVYGPQMTGRPIAEVKLDARDVIAFPGEDAAPDRYDIGRRMTAYRDGDMWRVETRG